MEPFKRVNTKGIRVAEQMALKVENGSHVNTVQHFEQPYSRGITRKWAGRLERFLAEERIAFFVDEDYANRIRIL